MREITAVDLGRSIERVLTTLTDGGEPYLVTVGDEPVAVLLSLRDFRERFEVEATADERRRVVDEILADVRPEAASIDAVFAELRGQ